MSNKECPISKEGILPFLVFSKPVERSQASLEATPDRVIQHLGVGYSLLDINWNIQNNTNRFKFSNPLSFFELY